MSYISLTFQCSRCEVSFGSLILRSERGGQPPACPSCSSPEAVKEGLQKPRVMRASYPDGTQRKGFGKLKRDADLAIEEADAFYEDRGEIQKERKKNWEGKE